MSTVLSTVVDYVAHGESGVKRPSRSLLHLNSAPSSSGTGLSTQPAQTAANGAQEEFELQGAATDPPAPVDDPELRLPNRGSLAIMIATNALLEVCEDLILFRMQFLIHAALVRLLRHHFLRGLVCRVSWRFCAVLWLDHWDPRRDLRSCPDPFNKIRWRSGIL
jgi:hypothetical protein